MSEQALTSIRARIHGQVSFGVLQELRDAGLCIALVPAPSAEPCAWQTVPKEATPQMRAVYVSHEDRMYCAAGSNLSGAFDDFYVALLAAAPPPPVAPSGVEALREARSYILENGSDKTMGPVIEQIDKALATQPKEPPK